jgi:hypothetical protein
MELFFSKEEFGRKVWSFLLLQYSIKNYRFFEKIFHYAFADF